MKNNCILITSHLNSKHKIDVALEQLNLIKSVSNLPIIFSSNYPIPKDIQKISNYSYYDKRNELTDFRMLFFWDLLQKDDTMGTEAKLMTRVVDHGFAHLNLMKRGGEFCKMLGYDYMYHFNYDVFLTKDNLETYIKYCEDKNNVFFEFKRFDDADSIDISDGDVGLHTRIFYTHIDNFNETIQKGLSKYPEVDIKHDR